MCLLFYEYHEHHGPQREFRGLETFIQHGFWTQAGICCGRLIKTREETLEEVPARSIAPSNSVYRQFSLVAQSCLTLCDPMDYSTPGFPAHHQLPEPTQTPVHSVGDAIQPSHPLIPFSSCLQSFSESGSFPVSPLFTSGSQSIGALESGEQNPDWNLPRNI